MTVRYRPRVRERRSQVATQLQRATRPWPMKTPYPTMLMFVCVAALGGCGKAEKRAPETDTILPTRTLIVCELMANLRAYQGKMVAVRGIYFWGLRQNGCAKPYVTGTKVWPAALNAVEAGDDPRDGFSSDLKSMGELYDLVLREGRLGKREEIWVTIIGRIRGPVIQGQYGFGHLNWAPAELVIHHVENLEIKPNPTYNYREQLYDGPL
jgi:hypothetical protein